VQKRIYQGFGGTREYNWEIWEKFGDKVGWRKGGKWRKWLHYKDITYDKKAPEGHLPSPLLRSYHWYDDEHGIGYVRAGGFDGRGFSRFETCKL
jgi:hypothetical protein